MLLIYAIAPNPEHVHDSWPMTSLGRDQIHDASFVTQNLTQHEREEFTATAPVHVQIENSDTCSSAKAFSPHP
jgi:hypothetical protein